VKLLALKPMGIFPVELGPDLVDQALLFSSKKATSPPRRRMAEE